MSEDNSPQYDELEELKAQADSLGMKYRKDITLENLKKKVREELADKEPANEDESEEDAEISDAGGEFADAKAPKGESDNARRVRKQREASELVRVQITCMNPNKKEWDGEMITAGNNIVGTYRKFVKFGAEYHIPRIIYNVMKDRQCQVFVTERDDRGRQVRKGKQISEFNIAVLQPLTATELKELAQRQAMANGQAA
jgi:hypothetical protein